ncbi:unnamed protein product [Taenia asiatica]|uniref:DUF5726 domain-containing protein n=1 Tax=Taenia asiatica TaxID=60517 RepID=A0A0R3W8L5_TAEAS|nr:unnamed protein product [Taenia asiatica]
MFRHKWQRVPLILCALSQVLFLAAINARVTADSDIGHCCRILSQLAIDQRQQSRAREFFHRDQKAGKNDKEVTNRVAVPFRVGVRPPTIAAKLHAMKTNDLNQTVKAATRKRQEFLLTPASQTTYRRPNPPRPRSTPSRQTPGAGEAYYSISMGVILGADFLLKTKAIMNFVEGTFTA